MEPLGELGPSLQAAPARMADPSVAVGKGAGMSRISFTVTDSERAEIEKYVLSKRRWRDPAALARDALFQLMERYPARNTVSDKTPVGGTAQGHR